MNIEPIDTFYVLRRKGTAKYMPQLDGRGYTHTEFVEDCIPRLFTTAAAAKSALTWWRKGPIYVDVDGQWLDESQGQNKDADVEIVTVVLGQ